MRSKKALKNVVALILMQLMAVIYGFVVPRIIIEQYGSEVNGLMASITQFLGYITLFEAGFGPVVKAALYRPLADKNLQEIANITEASERFFKRVAIIFLVYIMVLTVVYPLCINSGFDFIYTASLILIIAMSTFVEYFFGLTYQILLQASQMSYIAAGIQVAIYAASVAVTIILARIGVGVHVLKAVLCGLCLIKPIILNMYAKKKFNIKKQEINSDYELKNKWDGLTQHIAAVINDKTDVVVLTVFAGLKSVSIYSVYYLVVRSIKMLVDAITSGVSAAFGDIIAKKELKLLEKRFGAYETVYLMIVTILYCAALCLIIPFVATYTAGINDAEYIQPSFAVVFMFSGLVYTVRLPYNNIALAAGKFKETRRGAIVEAVLNIVISVICVIKMGLVGVAIGTLIAQAVRTAEFIYFTNKKIICRSMRNTIMKLIVMSIAAIISIILSNAIPFHSEGYLDLIGYTLAVVTPMAIIILLVNIVLYRGDFAEIMKIIRRKEKRRAV